MRPMVQQPQGQWPVLADTGRRTKANAGIHGQLTSTAPSVKAWQALKSSFSCASDHQRSHCTEKLEGSWIGLLSEHGVSYAKVTTVEGHFACVAPIGDGIHAGTGSGTTFTGHVIDLRNTKTWVRLEDEAAYQLPAADDGRPGDRRAMDEAASEEGSDGSSALNNSARAKAAAQAPAADKGVKRKQGDGKDQQERGSSKSGSRAEPGAKRQRTGAAAAERAAADAAAAAKGAEERKRELLARVASLHKVAQPAAAPKPPRPDPHPAPCQPLAEIAQSLCSGHADAWVSLLACSKDGKRAVYALCGSEWKGVVSDALKPSAPPGNRKVAGSGWCDGTVCYGKQDRCFNCATARQLIRGAALEDVLSGRQQVTATVVKLRLVWDVHNAQESTAELCHAAVDAAAPGVAPMLLGASTVPMPAAPQAPDAGSDGSSDPDSPASDESSPAAPKDPEAKARQYQGVRVTFMELIPGARTLWQVIHPKAGAPGRYSNISTRTWADLVAKVQALNLKARVAHGDLHHNNVIVLPDGSVRILDFDMSCLMQPEMVRELGDTAVGLGGMTQAELEALLSNPSSASGAQAAPDASAPKAGGNSSQQQQAAAAPQQQEGAGQGQQAGGSAKPSPMEVIWLLDSGSDDDGDEVVIVEEVVRHPPAAAAGARTRTRSTSAGAGAATVVTVGAAGPQAATAGVAGAAAVGTKRNAGSISGTEQQEQQQPAAKRDQPVHAVGAQAVTWGAGAKAGQQQQPAAARELSLAEVRQRARAHADAFDTVAKAWVRAQLDARGWSGMKDDEWNSDGRMIRRMAADMERSAS